MLADSFICLKKRYKYLLNIHYMPGQHLSADDQKCIYIWVKHSPCFQRDPWPKFWTGIYFQHAASISYFDYMAHMWLCSTQREFYSSMSNGNRTTAFSLRLNWNIYIMKFKIKFPFLMLTPAILYTNKQLENPYWIKWVN